MSSEQWLEQGKCNECRRKGYCNKPCKANMNNFHRRVAISYCKKILTGIRKENKND